MSAPLLVLCALAPEEWALRGGDWANALGGPPVLARTGMGPARAGRTLSTLLAAAPGVQRGADDRILRCRRAGNKTR